MAKSELDVFISNLQVSGGSKNYAGFYLVLSLTLTIVGVILFCIYKTVQWLFKTIKHLIEEKKRGKRAMLLEELMNQNKKKNAITDLMNLIVPSDYKIFKQIMKNKMDKNTGDFKQCVNLLAWNSANGEIVNVNELVNSILDDTLEVVKKRGDMEGTIIIKNYSIPRIQSLLRDELNVPVTICNLA